MEIRENIANHNGRSGLTTMPISSPNNQAYLDEAREIDRSITKMRIRQMRAYQEAESVCFCHVDISI